MTHPKYVIVVGVDYSAASERALEEAFTLGRAKHGVQLHVVNVREAPGDAEATDEAGLPPWRCWASELHEYVARKAAAFQATEGVTPFQRLYTHQRVSDPVQELIRLATAVKADLLVVGTHDWCSTSGTPAESVAEGVTRLAPCSVLVVHRHGSTLAEPMRPAASYGEDEAGAETG